MSFLHPTPPPDGVDGLLDRLTADEVTQSNCAFQLALMVARITLEPCSEAYKADSAHVLMDLIRSKPRSNVVRLFAEGPDGRAAGMARRGFA